MLVTPQKGVVLCAKDLPHQDALQNMICLDKSSTAAPSSNSSWTGNYLGGDTFRSIAVTAEGLRSSVANMVVRRVPGAAWLNGAASTVQLSAKQHMKAAKEAAINIVPPMATPTPVWKDPLMRWPNNRIVINNAEPFLEGPPEDVLRLSANLLRLAIQSQGAAQDVIHRLTQQSGALKCVRLDGLSPQHLWSFWVNVYHSLLVHGQLLAGRPCNLREVVGFYNKASYLVAGHVFSLVEIEHCILRRQMTRPKISVIRAVVFRIWERTDEDLEKRPCIAAPECSAACYSCRPDWRLNLVLNAGNVGSADAIPVFDICGGALFDKIVQSAVDRTLTCCGSVGKDVIELPYNLRRYREDAPVQTPRGETGERRWALALAPEAAKTANKICYSQKYGWAMRQRLELLSIKESI
jgi:hypothetical protein